MAQRAPIVGLDIGTTAVKVVVAEPGEDGSVTITGLGSAPSYGLRKGVIINIEATVEAISKAVAQAETMAGVQIKSVCAAISGSHLKGFNSHGMVGIKGREVTPPDTERVIDAAKAVAIPADREVLHVLPQEFIIDEQDGIKDPVGIAGVRLEAKVHIITGARASAQNVVKCANRCGLQVDDLVVGALASATSVLSPEERELGVVVVDIGGGCTDLMVFQNGAAKHTAVIPVGGNHITNDIAAGLRTPLAAAEEIKCRFGSASARLVSRDATIEVPSTGGRPARIMSKQLLAEIIEPRITEILSLVQRELMRAEVDEVLTSGVVITGGSSNLGGLVELAEQSLKLPVRVGGPLQLGGLTDLVRGADCATVVGVAQYGAEATRIGGRRAAHGFSLSRSLKRVGNWFVEHF